MARTINLPTGLPTTVNVQNPQELKRVVERLIELIQTMNGERGEEGKRLVTKDELDAALP